MNIPTIGMDAIGISLGKDGQTLRLEVADDDAAAHLILNAANAPLLCANILVAARDCLGQLPPEEQIKTMAANMKGNLLHPIPATSAKAVMAEGNGQLMIHLGNIVLHFDMPKEALKELAQEIEEQL